jgi:RNA polymerase sigma factor (sigma-70 family)
MATSRVEQFDTLIMPHLDDAYTLACYLLRNEHDAQDVVQDASLRAFRYFDGYRGGDARAWFLAIVRNCCLTWQRRHRNDRLSTPLEAHHASAARETRAADARAIETRTATRSTGPLPSCPWNSVRSSSFERFKAWRTLTSAPSSVCPSAR